MTSNSDTSLQTLKAHQSDVTCCAFGKNFTLASGSSDKTVRAWEWSPGQGFAELSFSPLGCHAYGVTDARFSPQGTMLATSSIDGSTVLWNIRAGCRIHAFVQPNGSAVRVCRFTPDSTRLVTAGDDGTICVWNLAHRSLVRSYHGHEDVVQALSTSPDSALVVSGCSQGILRVWDLSGNLLTSQDAAHDLGVTAVDFSPTPQPKKHGLLSEFLLASCGLDHLVRLWVVRADKVNHSLSPLATLSGHSSSVLCVRFSPSGSLLASGGLDKTIRVWESSGKCINILEGHDRYVTSCAFSKDGSLLASGSNDKFLKIWDLTEKLSLNSELMPINKIPLDKANGLLDSNGSEQRIVKRAEEEEISVVKLLQKLECGVCINSCHFSPGTSLLAAASADKILKIWQQEGNRFKELFFSPIEAHRYSVNQVEFSPGGSFLASCSLDGTAALWLTEDGQRSKNTLKTNGSAIRTCRFSPNGHLVVTGGDDEKATLWNVSNSFVKVELEGHTEAVSCAAFSPDSEVLATGDLAGSVKIWCLNTHQGLVVLESAHDLGTQSCDFSPTEGKTAGGRYLLVTGGNDSMVKLWWVETNYASSPPSYSSPARVLKGHGGNVTCVRFAPTGQLIASTATDKTARIWNVYLEECLFTLESHSSIVTCCAFTDDSSLLATGSLDKTLVVWELPREVLVRSLAAERLRIQWPKLLDWTPKDISRWLTWIDVPQVPAHKISKLSGADMLHVSGIQLAEILGLEDEKYVRELHLQLFWLRREEEGNLEDLLSSGLPHELLCPITQELLREPVICADGFTYEQAAIDEWFLSGKISSPMTNLPLQDTSYLPNIKLRAHICCLLYGDQP